MDTSDSSLQVNWWKSDSESEVHKNVKAWTNHVEKQQQYRTVDNLRYLRLYSNYEILGLGANSYSRPETNYGISNRVTLNIIQSMCDTVQSKIAKNKPKPTFLTKGAEWSLRSKAKKLNQFIEGQFYSQKIFEKAQMAFLEGCIFGTGALKFYKCTETNKVKCERVFTDEILVDDIE